MAATQTRTYSREEPKRTATQTVNWWQYKWQVQSESTRAELPCCFELLSEQLSYHAVLSYSQNSWATMLFWATVRTAELPCCFELLSEQLSYHAVLSYSQNSWATVLFRATLRTAELPCCFELLSEQLSYHAVLSLSLIHIWRCRRSTLCRSRWSPYH